MFRVLSIRRDEVDVGTGVEGVGERGVGEILGGWAKIRRGGVGVGVNVG